LTLGSHFKQKLSRNNEAGANQGCIAKRTGNENAEMVYTVYPAWVNAPEAIALRFSISVSADTIMPCNAPPARVNELIHSVIGDI